MTEQLYTIYNDKMYSNDPMRYDDLCMKYFGDTGNSWYTRDMKGIEQFLQEYTGIMSLVLDNIEKYSNKVDNCTVWSFNYHIL